MSSRYLPSAYHSADAYWGTLLLTGRIVGNSAGCRSCSGSFWRLKKETRPPRETHKVAQIPRVRAFWPTRSLTRKSRAIRGASQSDGCFEPACRFALSAASPSSLRGFEFALCVEPIALIFAARAATFLPLLECQFGDRILRHLSTGCRCRTRFGHRSLGRLRGDARGLLRFNRVFFEHVDSFLNKRAALKHRNSLAEDVLDLGAVETFFKPQTQAAICRLWDNSVKNPISTDLPVHARSNGFVPPKGAVFQFDAITEDRLTTSPLTCQSSNTVQLSSLDGSIRPSRVWFMTAGRSSRLK
jgi:hypothetical protein